MVPKNPKKAHRKLKTNLKVKLPSVSHCTTCSCLSQSGLGRSSWKTTLLKTNQKKARVEPTKLYVYKPQSVWENVLLDRQYKTGSFFTYTLALCSQMYTTKRTLSLLWNIEDALILCTYILKMLCCMWHRVSWNSNKYNEISTLTSYFYRVICCPLSESRWCVLSDDDDSKHTSENTQER